MIYGFCLQLACINTCICFTECRYMRGYSRDNVRTLVVSVRTVVPYPNEITLIRSRMVILIVTHVFKTDTFRIEPSSIIHNQIHIKQIKCLCYDDEYVLWVLLIQVHIRG